MSQVTSLPLELRILSNLKASGFLPDTVFYIGASSRACENLVASCPVAHCHVFHFLADTQNQFFDLARRLNRLTLHSVALGEINGTTEVPARREGSDGRPQAKQNPAAERPIRVPSSCLDDYVEQHRLNQAQVIKIEGDGAERALIRGGQKTLAGARVVFVKTWLKRSPRLKTALLHEITELLEELGFSLMGFGDTFSDQQGRLNSVEAVFYSDQLIREIAPQVKPTSQQDRIRLSGDLLRLIGKPPTILEEGEHSAEFVDLIVSHAEINNRHGVGVLLNRLFGGDDNVLEVHSREMFGGEASFGRRSRHLTYESSNGDEIYSKLLRTLGDSTVQRVLCVPYYPEDVRTAIAAKEVYNVPMCTFLMDDQNIFDDGIPDSLMTPLLARSALRLAISPDLREAYQQKYKLPFWYMPPVVTDRLIPEDVVVVPANADPNAAVMIGNVWGEQWLRRLRLTLRESGVKVTWHSNAGFDEVSASREDLEADSLFPSGSIPDDELIALLRNRVFAIVPSGTLEPDDDRSFLARLSLPSRLIFMMATSHIPVIVLGHADTTVAKFVTKLGIGLVAPYRKQPFLEAVREISDPATNRAMRLRAHNLARRFSDKQAADWIWKSLEKGEPIDSRFEELLDLSPVAAEV